jgi:hypothetical protein
MAAQKALQRIAAPYTESPDLLPFFSLAYLVKTDSYYR